MNFLSNFIDGISVTVGDKTFKNVFTKLGEVVGKIADELTSDINIKI